MSYTVQSRIRVPSTWLELNGSAIALLLTATALLGTASLVAMAIGEPETMALVALAGMTVVLLGTAAVRLSESLRTRDVSIRQ